MQNAKLQFKIQKFEKLKKELPGVQKNISLRNYTTFQIGGPAEYFFIAKTKKELLKSILTAKKFNLPFFVFGGGSNLLVADNGFNGLIIKIQKGKQKESLRFPTPKENKFPTGQGGQAKFKTIYTEAGVPLAVVVSKAAEKSLTGLEWAAGIPGTVGGAIYGNAGSFDNSMADIVKAVEVLEISDKKNQKNKLSFKNLNCKQCKFDYRNSIFKNNKNLIIISALLHLKKNNKKEIQKKIKKYLDYKKQTQPLNFPSAGSVFKNSPGFSAGELIEKCNLRGKKIGNVKISEKHANFIVNLGMGKADDVKKLINLAKRKVKNKFGIILKEEIQFLNSKN